MRLRYDGERVYGRIRKGESLLMCLRIFSRFICINMKPSKYSLLNKNDKEDQDDDEAFGNKQFRPRQI